MPYAEIQRCPPKTSTICQNLTPFTKIEHHTPKFNAVHQNSTPYTKIRPHTPNSTPFSKSQHRTPKLSTICQNPAPYTKFQRRSPSSSTVSRNSTPYTEIQHDTPSSITVHQNLYIKFCPGSPNLKAVAAEPLLPSPNTELHCRTHLRCRTYNLCYMSTILSTINGIFTTIHSIVTAELLLLPLNAEFHGRAYFFDHHIPAYYVQRSQYYM